MKLKFKKLLVVILVIVTLINVTSTLIESNNVLAKSEEEMFREQESGWETAGGYAMDFLDGVIGLLTYPTKLIIMAIGAIIQVLVAGITAFGGSAVCSVEGILFNKTPLTSVNFFELPSGAGSTDAIFVIRNCVAGWYVAMRNLAIVILLGILLYVGIRMALATVGEQEAKYKKMLVDWVVSLALVFVLHYIMIFTININDTLVDIIAKASGNNEQGYQTAVGEIAKNAFSLSFSRGFGSAIIYVILVGMTIVFLIMYIKRMLTVGFLIMIAPLITITYSIDKMGDGKSQALNSWLKEFVFNILIQPFHCVIYVMFTNTAIDLLTKNNDLASAVLSIIMITFIFSAEKIIKKIFNFQAGSLGDAIGNTAFLATGMSMMSKAGKNSKGTNPDDIKKMDNKGKVKEVSEKSASKNGSEKTEKTAKTAEGKKSTNTQTSSQSTANNKTKAQSSSTSGGTAKAKKSKGAEIAGNIMDKITNPQTYIKAADSHLKAGTRIAFGALGLATGNAKAGLSGMYAGDALYKGGKNLFYNKPKAKKLVEQNQESFAGGYSNFQTKTGYTDKEMQKTTAKFLGMSKTEAQALSDDEYEYWADVQNMKGTFEATGDSNSDDAVMDTVAMIQSGEIEPAFDGEEEWVRPPEPETKTEETKTEKKKSNNTSKKKQKQQKKKKSNNKKKK